MNKYPTDNEDLVIWPDNTWCFAEEIDSYSWKSDDYVVISVEHEKYAYFINCKNLYDEVMEGFYNTTKEKTMINEAVKKPVKIEYCVLDQRALDSEEFRNWIGDYIGNTVYGPDGSFEVHIKTLEDGNLIQVQHIATEGDVIIRGVSGEFYPCKMDIFKKTYDEI